MFFNRAFVALFFVLTVGCSISETPDYHAQSVQLAGNCELLLPALLDWVRLQTGARYVESDVSSAYCGKSTRGGMVPNEVILGVHGTKLFIGQGLGMAASGADSYISVCVSDSDAAVRDAVITSTCRIQQTSECDPDEFMVDEVTVAVLFGGREGGVRRGFCAFGVGTPPFTPSS